jgi:hypothetical protein
LSRFGRSRGYLVYFPWYLNEAVGEQVPVGGYVDGRWRGPALKGKQVGYELFEDGESLLYRAVPIAT